MNTSNVITVVSGLPRSGTSMMMRMIDAGGVPALTDNIRQPDEDNPLGYFEFEAVKQTKKDDAWVDRAVGKVVKLVHVLLYDLPRRYEYRVIFMKRKLEEVVKSQNVMLARGGKSGGNLSDTQIIDAFRRQLEKIEQWLAEQPNFKVLYVQYNDVVQNPAPAVQKVCDFFGGQLNVAAMLGVVDPKLYRQRAT